MSRRNTSTRQFSWRAGSNSSDLYVFLLENDLAAVVSDFRSAAFPFNLIKWRDGSIAEYTLETQAAIFLLSILFFSTCGRVCRFI